VPVPDVVHHRVHPVDRVEPDAAVGLDVLAERGALLALAVESDVDGRDLLVDVHVHAAEDLDHLFEAFEVHDRGGVEP
jgi:hypothetical protein